MGRLKWTLWACFGSLRTLAARDAAQRSLHIVLLLLMGFVSSRFPGCATGPVASYMDVLEDAPLPQNTFVLES